MPMWAVKNYTPYAAGKVWGRDKDGVHEWIIAVKGTFDIDPKGELTLSEEQPEPLLLPVYNGEDGLSSLRYEADLVSPKPTTDIVINGTAYAPKGRPTREFLVSVRVGNIYKQLKVIGNRRWEKGLLGLTPSKAEPIVKMPIIYERAFGGFDQSDLDPKKQKMDPRNPVGCGLEPLLDQPLPNVEYVERQLKTVPAGFGAIASHWSPRRELQGTYDDAWQKDRFPLLPEDWDPRSLLCSPADQRSQRHLSGGELVELENLTPSGKLAFALPKVRLGFRTRIDNEAKEHYGRLATVIIEPHDERVSMVWHSWLPVRNNGDYLDETVIIEKRFM